MLIKLYIVMFAQNNLEKTDQEFSQAPQLLQQ